MGSSLFNIYLLYIVSIFLHLPARIEVLGTIRFDLLLVCIITGMLFLSRERTLQKQHKNEIARILLVLVGYVVLTVPFVEWPGSVI